MLRRPLLWGSSDFRGPRRRNARSRPTWPLATGTGAPEPGLGVLHGPGPRQGQGPELHGLRGGLLQGGHRGGHRRGPVKPREKGGRGPAGCSKGELLCAQVHLLFFCLKVFSLFSSSFFLFLFLSLSLSPSFSICFSLSLSLF